jgi:hypothetical protein
LVHDRPVSRRRLSSKAHRHPPGGTAAHAQSKLLIPLSRRALTQRLARALLRDGKVLRKTRAPSARDRVGDFFVVDANGGIVAHHVDLRQLAHELDVLKTYETTEN